MLNDGNQIYDHNKYVVTSKYIIFMIHVPII